MHPKYIKACRICGSRNLEEIVDLGEQFLQGSFVQKDSVEPPRRKLPTRLIRCDVTKGDEACGHVQLAHTFPPTILYSNYWYRSGTNQTMRDHLRGIAETANGLVTTPATGLRVLDIGCNDGTLLSCYPSGTELFGVDPSDIAKSIDFPVTLVNTVFPSQRASRQLEGTEFDIITSIAMFYDLEDPTEFARQIAALLKEEGIWVVEMSYLPLMLAQNSFDTICHEHIGYFSLAVLERIFSAVGLRAFRVEINDINGGSIRCYVCKEGARSFDAPENERLLQQLRLLEFEMALDSPAPFAAFKRRIIDQRDDMRAILRGLKHQKQRIHVYGASTKGNVLLQWYGIDSSIVEAAAERNPHKVGGRTLGTDIPIISEEESRHSAPGYYLVLPWHFKLEFLKRERETMNRGATFIFPLPKVEMVNAANVDQIIAETSQEHLSTEARLVELMRTAV